MKALEKALQEDKKIDEESLLSVLNSRTHTYTLDGFIHSVDFIQCVPVCTLSIVAHTQAKWYCDVDTEMYIYVNVRVSEVIQLEENERMKMAG